MELGGSDAFVVLDDADLDHTVAMAILGRFGNNGQICIGAKRFIVVESVLGKFLPPVVPSQAIVACSMRNSLALRRMMKLGT
jgi:succinate-semialdehyde dehydrogenase/glutarate-semialdehyde dehydrogenase